VCVCVGGGGCLQLQQGLACSLQLCRLLGTVVRAAGGTAWGVVR